MRINRTGFATAALIAAFGIVVALAARSSEHAPKVEPPTYRPGTSDLMNAFIQPRHVRLWLVGNQQNWAYAEYEGHNIGGALGRLATAIPSYKDQPTSDLVAAFATPQLARLESAIKAKDKAAFVAAYAELTAGCNGCHQATGHGFVVMQSPGIGPFPDQTFTQGS